MNETTSPTLAAELAELFDDGAADPTPEQERAWRKDLFVRSLVIRVSEGRMTTGYINSVGDQWVRSGPFLYDIHTGIGEPTESSRRAFQGQNHRIVMPTLSRVRRIAARVARHRAKLSLTNLLAMDESVPDHVFVAAADAFITTLAAARLQSLDAALVSAPYSGKESGVGAADREAVELLRNQSCQQADISLA